MENAPHVLLAGVCVRRMHASSPAFDAAKRGISKNHPREGIFHQKYPLGLDDRLNNGRASARCRGGTPGEESCSLNGVVRRVEELDVAQAEV